MKKNFYTSVLWIGLAIASTTSYAKPHHVKHASAQSKSAKASSRPVSSRSKHTAINHYANVHTTPKKVKLRSIFSVRSLDRRTPLTRITSESLDQAVANEPYIAPTLHNERIHSFIPAHGNSESTLRPMPATNHLGSHITSVHGIVENSLATAGQKAGLSPELIFQLTNIFAWDIDFATNLNQGDQFTVVYEDTKLADNSTDSQIVAAEFVNQGRILTAVRYKDREGQINYFSPEGKPMRKAFLSSPVDFVRISSGFDTHRRHPILNRIRAHKGVDYAARTGTPVRSSGDGEVAFRGRKGGYGQVMVVKHGDRYETLYAHLSDFKKGLNVGDQVKQGEVIAYVGQTGLATGPHLHYEFLVDGVHRNPEALNKAQSLPLHGEVLAEFKSQANPLLTQLNKTKSRSLFAKNQLDYN